MPLPGSAGVAREKLAPILPARAAIRRYNEMSLVQRRICLRMIRALVRAAALLARESRLGDEAREGEPIAAELLEPLPCALDPAEPPERSAGLGRGHGGRAGTGRRRAGRRL